MDQKIFNSVHERLTEIVPFTTSEIEDFVSILKVVRLKKGDYFIREGEVCTKGALILSGIFRNYFFQERERR
ncbi:cyclic nucleotide-binding domain-containing protein [Flammeovirga kamogawensis]|uniref:Cyclic nucleotide-binding domain-containing protein n=1 Tax=Flammeovirga kamogawensis TaxID=373891 RepID=A0ABX8GZG2_9BACT|nr:hypothetical protein [Flammeovirga kamogawensis]MBB6459445.1 hypothetical protein [Flammeovirga kamogawensis]QWG08998.1 hypothetical protein KM029_08660 [Flammeovirga kamogawensis]